MNTCRLLRITTTTAAVLALSLVMHGVARAQSGTVSGIVVAGGTQRPLGGVQIGVEGTAGRGATTDGSGRFTISGLTGPTAVLTVRFIGYRPVADTVRVGATDVRIALAERVLELDQMVVTGTAGFSIDGGPVRTLPAHEALSKSHIVFTPDGGSSGGTIVLASGQKRIAVTVNWLTGRVRAELKKFGIESK